MYGPFPAVLFLSRNHYEALIPTLYSKVTFILYDDSRISAAIALAAQPDLVQHVQELSVTEIHRARKPSRQTEANFEAASEVLANCEPVKVTIHQCSEPARTFQQLRTERLQHLSYTAIEVGRGEPKDTWQALLSLLSRSPHLNALTIQRTWSMQTLRQLSDYLVQSVSLNPELRAVNMRWQSASTERYAGQAEASVRQLREVCIARGIHATVQMPTIANRPWKD